MHPWRVRAVAFAVSASCLLACSATTAPQAPERASTAELAVTVSQQRVDATTRTVGVDTTNLADRSVHVSAVRLSGGGIDAATTPLDTDLIPGGPAPCAPRTDGPTAMIDVTPWSRT